MWPVVVEAVHVFANHGQCVPLVVDQQMVGALLAQAAGWWSLRGVLNKPVVQTLREASSE